jgi:hypothetical protein
MNNYLNQSEQQPSTTIELKLSRKAYEKITSYTQAVETEIGGLLVMDSKDPLLVKDALIFKQEVSGSETELDSKTLIKYLESMAKRSPRKIESIKGWWHSHAKMAVFWSGTDDTCFSDMLSVMPTVFGIVVNKSGEMLARVDLRTDIGNISLNNLKVNIMFPTAKQAYIKEAKRKVKEKTYEYPNGFRNYGYTNRHWEEQWQGNQKEDNTKNGTERRYPYDIWGYE